MIVERLDGGTPLGSVIDLEMLRSHLRTNGVDEFDWEIFEMAKAAALEAERFAEIALLTHTVRVTLDQWLGGQIMRLPISPLLDASTVSVMADDSPVLGFMVTTGLRSSIRLADRPPCGQVVIEYDAGWPDAALVPVDLRLAIMDQALAYFDARGAGDVKVQAQSPQFARIVGRYRRVGL